MPEVIAKVIAKTATLADALTDRARRDPGRMALAIARRGRGGRYDEVSLGELERDAGAYAAILASRGIRKGMRTVTMITPGREFCAVVYALLKLGAPPVFIDPGVGLRHVGTCLENVNPEAFIGIRKAQLARRLFGWGRESIRISLTVESLRRGESGGREVPQFDSSAESDAVIAFTSGSTGTPKAVVLDHANLMAQAEMVSRLLGPLVGEPHLATLPLFLVFAPALGVPAIIPDMDASKPATADPSRLIAAIEHYRCRSTFVSPAVLKRLGSWCRETKRPLSSIECVLSAGAPSDPRALANLAAAIAPDGEVFTPYGATEALPVSNIGCREILTDTGAKTGVCQGVCIGRPVDGMTAAIIPIEDAPIRDWSEVAQLPAYEIGEIAVSGPVVSKRYFNNPDATALAKIPSRSDGALYHRMGDLGYRDEQGRLWMCGRKSQRVVTAKRVYFTVPTERVFNAHEQVARTALVGVPGNGSKVPVLCVELATRESAAAKKRITKELAALGANFENTREIRHFLYRGSFPVDARHNSKILREVLAVWAKKKLRREQEFKEDRP
jgi:acyl-CoA synthetase (AMP-forming)/AMP-acid ligase II